jgi:hypothetical protein
MMVTLVKLTIGIIATLTIALANSYVPTPQHDELTVVLAPDHTAKDTKTEAFKISENNATFATAIETKDVYLHWKIWTYGLTILTSKYL